MHHNYLLQKMTHSMCQVSLVVKYNKSVMGGRVVHFLLQHSER